MMLLKTHFHTSERRGNEAGKARQKKRKEGVTVSDWNKSSTKVIAMPPTTGGRVKKFRGKAKSEYKNRKEK